MKGNGTVTWKNHKFYIWWKGLKTNLKFGNGYVKITVNVCFKNKISTVDFTC